MYRETAVSWFIASCLGISSRKGFHLAMCLKEYKNMALQKTQWILFYIVFRNLTQRQRELIEEFSKEEHGEDDKRDEKRNAAGASG